MKAYPFTESVLSAKTVRAGPENMLNANELPDAAKPIAEFTAGPEKSKVNQMLLPNQKSVK